MNEILKHALSTLIMVPIIFVLLKLIFKKSIMFKFSFYTTILMLIISYNGFLTGHLGGHTNLYAIGVNLSLGVVVFVYINKILRKPLENSISQVKSISDGH